VALGLAALVETLLRARGNSPRFVLVLCLLALSTTLPPAFLRPASAAIAVCAADVLALAPFHALTVAGVCTQLIVLFRLTDAGSQLLAGALVTPYLILALFGPSQSRVPAVALAALAPTAAWAGAALRARREAAEHSATRDLVDGTLIAHTARGERARIARELHDVVAHHISMVAVQAEAARLTTPGLPAAGAQRLSAIGDTARAALTEMRRLLGVLREDAEHEAPDLAPQPGLRQLNELLDEARAATGAGTRLILYGPPELLDPGVELAVYRIVQEALTNARRHAPGAAVDVELHYTEDTVRLRIRDNGPGQTSTEVEGGGLGLLGMRERAVAVGGRLRCGPVTGGGFLVEATLPAKTEVSG
jgi:signal transduction histidine kinase